jgi:hypothetical protein
MKFPLKRAPEKLAMDNNPERDQICQFSKKDFSGLKELG